MDSRPHVVLDSVLLVMRPLARLMLRNGVTYPAFSAALKRVFLDAARAELASQGMPQTDSAVTLLSGVHRRDVRNLKRAAVPERAAAPGHLGLVGQVVARWMSEAAYLNDQGAPRRLPRAGDAPGFDALVASVSSDVRPRAMLDEMLRLGVVSEDETGVELVASGFAPRQGFAESASLLAANLHDHAAAAALNLAGESNFLEQAIYVDQLTEASAKALHKVSAQAWKQAFKTMMQQAQKHFDIDQAQLSPSQRKHRARFGVYFFSDNED